MSISTFKVGKAIKLNKVKVISEQNSQNTKVEYETIKSKLLGNFTFIVSLAEQYIRMWKLLSEWLSFVRGIIKGDDCINCIQYHKLKYPDCQFHTQLNEPA